MRDYSDVYSASEEPWDYSRRAAEILRHETIVRELRTIRPFFSFGLDVGCSLGQMTRRLKSITRDLFACDVSLAAVRKARGHPASGGIRFLAAGLPGIPLGRESLDLLVIADGIHEFVPEALRGKALLEIRSLLKKEGVALFSDYMRPGSFDPFIRAVSGHFRILKLVYLNDRLWYQFESWFKAVRHWEAIKIILSQIWIAKFLRLPSALLGPRGSTHILILAQKL